MTVSVDELTALVRAQTRRASRRYAGLAVGAFVADQTVTYGTGRARADDGPPTPDTLFQIGSITKVFTALALADAVVRDELSLDSPLAGYLPETPLPKNGVPITLGHLASHTSGLPRLPKGLRRQALHHRQDPYANFSIEDLLSALSAARPRAAGVKVRYSNFGAGLLGEVLSRHAGMPYEKLVRQRVVGPLGLQDTVVTTNAEQASRRAVGHSRRKHPVPDWHLGAMPGAGALRSTVHDLIAFLRANLDPDDTALPEAIRLTQVPRAAANRWLKVGLGWFLSPVRGTELSQLWHNGGTGGHFSYVAVVPAARIGVAVLTNTARPVDPVGFRVLRTLLDVAGGHRVIS